jgi:hypothetical protein
MQKKIMGRTYNMLDPDELNAAFQDGMLEHCSAVVGRAARKTAEIIAREREGDS